MIEDIVIDYLDSELDVPVSSNAPQDQVACYVLVERTGGTEEDHICYATLVIQSYAPSKYLAAELNEKVKKAMKNIIALDSVFSAKLNSDYNFTDTTTEKHRYQAVYQLVY